MFKKGILLSLLFLGSLSSYATTPRYLDGQFITNGANTLTIPSITDTLSSTTLTETLTNKTISGASNTISNIPTSSFTGTTSVSNGGTGASSLTANNVIIGNGTSAVNFVAPGSSGNVLTSNGTTWTSSSPPTTPSIVGSAGSPTAITAVGGITFSGTNYQNYNFIVGSGGPVTVTANPQISAATNVGQVLVLIAKSATNTVTISDGNGLSLNGAWVGGLNSVITLVWDGSNWIEESRR